MKQARGVRARTGAALRYACEHDCGLVGGFDAVAEHERGCALRRGRGQRKQAAEAAAAKAAARSVREEAAAEAVAGAVAEAKRRGAAAAGRSANQKYEMQIRWCGGCAKHCSAFPPHQAGAVQMGTAQCAALCDVIYTARKCEGCKVALAVGGTVIQMPLIIFCMVTMVTRE